MITGEKMIEPDNAKGKKTIEGEERNAIKSAEVVNHNELRIQLYNYKDMQYEFNTICKNITGHPMREMSSHQSMGDVKFLLNDIVSYIDFSGIVRIVDLSNHGAYYHKSTTVSVNNNICEWD